MSFISLSKHLTYYQYRARDSDMFEYEVLQAAKKPLFFFCTMAYTAPSFETFDASGCAATESGLLTPASGGVGTGLVPYKTLSFKPTVH